jgi:hypothetical protein
MEANQNEFQRQEEAPFQQRHGVVALPTMSVIHDIESSHRDFVGYCASSARPRSVQDTPSTAKMRPTDFIVGLRSPRSTPPM